MKDKVVIPEIKKTHKILLAIGLVCIIVGTLLQIFLINKSRIDFAVIRSIVITFLGATILYFACLKKDSMWRYLLGLFLTLGGFFFALIDTCFENHDIKTLWPILVSLAGISIIFSAVFSKKRITFSIIFPSVVLIFMGVIFFFFTLDIIKTSFISLVTHLLPLFLIISGAVLFGAFFYVQSGRQHINPELIEDDED